MTQVKLSDVIVPTERFGDRTPKLTEMVLSLREFGQIHPILLERRDGKLILIAGWRRFFAAQVLEWEMIEATFRDEMSELDRKRIELEENVQRLELSFAEKAEAVSALHELKLAEDPTWTLEKTAAITGTHKGHVSKQLAVAKELKNDPELANAQTLVGALERITRKRQLAQKELQVKMSRSKGESGKLSARVICGDALELIKSIPDSSIDAVVTDPPFGIRLDFDGEEPFDDRPANADAMMMEMIPEFHRILKDESWVVIFYALEKLVLNKYVAQAVDTKHIPIWAGGIPAMLRSAGFTYITPMPCLWIKPDKLFGRTSPKTNLVHGYEAFIFASKGEPRMFSKKRSDLFEHDPPDDKYHGTQKPVSLMTEITAMVTIAGQTVLDPFAGSGATGLGALDHGCEFIGFEISPEYAAMANTLLGAHQLVEKADTDVISGVVA